jgi:hypothetical protein
MLPKLCMCTTRKAVYTCALIIVSVTRTTDGTFETTPVEDASLARPHAATKQKFSNIALEASGKTDGRARERITRV